MERDPLLVTILKDGSVELSQDSQVDQTATTHDLVEVQMTRHPEKPTTTEMTVEGFILLGGIALLTTWGIFTNSTGKR